MISIDAMDERLFALEERCQALESRAVAAENRLQAAESRLLQIATLGARSAAKMLTEEQADFVLKELSRSEPMRIDPEMTDEELDIVRKELLRIHRGESS